MKKLIKLSFVKMWKLSFVLAIAGVFKWYTDNSDPFSYSAYVRLALGLILLILIPPTLLAITMLIDDWKNKRNK